MIILPRTYATVPSIPKGSTIFSHFNSTKEKETLFSFPCTIFGKHQRQHIIPIPSNSFLFLINKFLRILQLWIIPPTLLQWIMHYSTYLCQLDFMSCRLIHFINCIDDDLHISTPYFAYLRIHRFGIPLITHPQKTIFR
jgi:hypothetical protein